MLLRPWRRISRTLLFTRFLSCAFPSFRGVVSPNRLIAKPFFSANNTKEREIRLAPSSYTFLNSAAFLSRKSLGNVLVVFNGDALPAFVPSRLQYKPSTSSLHSLTESMGFRATTIVRLVCPLWHSSSSFENFKCTTRALQKSVAFVIENAKWKCYPFAAFTPIWNQFSTAVEILVDISPLSV
jgi:hypothetical protein